MSQISTRSRGVTKKITAVPKPRKKVAPKVVSTRPKKKNDTSQTDEIPPASKFPSPAPSPEPIPDTRITSSPPILANEVTVISTLGRDRENIPLPTLPSEEASNSLSSSLQLPLPTAADICTDVNELFEDQHSTDQEGGIGEELLSLTHSSSAVVERTVSLVVTETRTESTDSAVSNSGCLGDVSGHVTRSERSPEAVSPVSSEGSESRGGVSTDVGVAGEETDRAVSPGEPAAEEDSASTEKPQPKKSRKRSQADSTLKESGDQSSPPRAKKRKNTVMKERKAPDRTTMTMQELIYYNPTANPMQAAKEEKERRRGSTAPPSPEKESPTEPEAGPKSSQTRQSSIERGAGSEDRLVPQLRIGADGNIVIDEASMVVATTQSANPYDDSEAIIETSGQVTSESFRKGYKITRWSKDETTKFFKALSHVGTDFTMMTLLVPNRSRKELKNKFKREEKRSPHLIAQALKNQIKVKVSS